VKNAEIYYEMSGYINLVLAVILLIA